MVLIRCVLLALITGFSGNLLIPVTSQAQTVIADTTSGEVQLPIIDITLERKENGQIKFVPVVENVEIGQVYWDFGDGTDSRLRYPKHQFRAMAIPRVVTLTINNDPGLSVSRFVNPSIRYDFEERFPVELSSRSVEPFFGNFIPESYKEHIRRLSEMPSFHNLQSYLIWLSREEIITSFGSRGDMRQPNWGYILLVDPRTGSVETILGAVYNRYRYDLTTISEKKYRDNEWQSELRGLRPIWIQFK